MRLLPAATLLTAAALPLALAACTTGSPSAPAPAAAPPSAAPSPANLNAGLLTGTQLKGLLEPRSYFPQGYARDPAGTRDTGSGYQQPVATACPGYTDPQTGSRATVSEKASPRFAEGGYVITVTDPAWRSGTTLVAARAGTAVVTVLSTDGADNGHASAMRLASQLVALLQGMT